MPVKMGARNTQGCTGSKPWPIIEVASGRKVACAGPSRARAVSAVRIRNMKSKGITPKGGWRRK